MRARGLTPEPPARTMSRDVWGRTRRSGSGEAPARERELSRPQRRSNRDVSTARPGRSHSVILRPSPQPRAPLPDVAIMCGALCPCSPFSAAFGLLLRTATNADDATPEDISLPSRAVDYAEGWSAERNH